MIEQLTMFDHKMSIKQKVFELLRDGWFSSTQIVFAIGATSADRRRRDLNKEGKATGKWSIIERDREDGITQYHLEVAK